MRELRVFSLCLDPRKGFDETALQAWLGAGRSLVHKTDHLVQTATGTWLILLVETERHTDTDPWERPAPHPPAEAKAKQDRQAESARARQRREQRAARKRDLEAALTRLDEPSRAFLETLRGWRLARASAEGLPPYEFGSDLLLCEVARVRPLTAQALRDLPQCKPRFFKLAGEDLLEVVRAFEAGEEQAWRAHKPPEGEANEP